MTFAIRMRAVAGYPFEKWSQLTVLGFSALSRSRALEAARRWLDADAALPEERSSFAPINAASRSNAGAAYVLLDQRAAAETAFDEAVCAWKNIISQIAVLDVPMTGASSSYHFRLAASVPEALIAARRDRYRALAQAALAITGFNRRFLDDAFVGSVSMRENAHELRSMISDSLGYASAEARLLMAMEEEGTSESLCEIYAGKLSEITGSRATLASGLSDDCKKFEHSVAMTALLTAPMCLAARSDNHGTLLPKNFTTATGLSLNDV